jgi:hypothetical protein
MELDHPLKRSPPRKLKKESLRMLKTKLQDKGATFSRKIQTALHPTLRASTTPTPTPTQTLIQVMKRTRTVMMIG